MKTEVGEWNLAAAFNWDEKNEAAIPLELSRLGLDPEQEYMVYDFWRETYLGLAKRELVTTAPPGSVRLLGLRPFHGRPTFFATDSHISQGATDFTSLEWDDRRKRLSGSFEGVEDTDYNLRVFVPEPFEPAETVVSTGNAVTEFEDRVLVISFHCREPGSVEWYVQF
jgi:hypothetical protein